ncbi:hypothetical protein GCM10027416_26480 [Okibacterium endophyticum]
MSNPTPGSTPPEDEPSRAESPADEFAGNPDAPPAEPEPRLPSDQTRDAAQQHDVGDAARTDTGPDLAGHGHAHTPEVAHEAYAADTSDEGRPSVITPSEPQANTTSFDDLSEAHSAPAQQRHAHTRSGPVFVQAPTPPQKKGNRGFGILIGLLATLVFALVYGGVLALVTLLSVGSVDIVGGILVRAPFWLPVVMFFIAMAVLAAIVNRGGWWAYVIGGFFVAVCAYGAYIGGVLVERAFMLTPADVGPFVTSILLTPPAVVAFVVGREVPVWFGAWIAARGRKVRERNDEQQREYDRLLEQGPVV